MEKTSSDYVALMANSGLSDLKNAESVIQSLSQSNIKKKSKNTIFGPIITIDLSQSNNQIIEMIGDCSLVFINGEDGDTYKILFKQKNAGRFEILNWGNVKFPYARPPNLSNDTNSVDILVLYAVETSLYATLINDFR